MLIDLPLLQSIVEIETFKLKETYIFNITDERTISWYLTQVWL